MTAQELREACARMARLDRAARLHRSEDRSLIPGRTRLVPGFLAALAFALVSALPAAALQADDVPGEARPPVSAEATDLSPRIAPAPLEAQEGAVDPETYVLGPGDELALEVLGRVSLSQRATVDPDGDLWVHDFGKKHVAGQTLAAAREEIRRMFRGGSRGLDATLRLVRLRRFKVYVAGEVKHPGVLQVTAMTRASEAIDACGGLNVEASTRNIVLRGGSHPDRILDVIRFNRLGVRAANPTLLDGDQIFVPRHRHSIYLYGAVSYPGEYEFHEGDKLSDLIALTGGLLPNALPENGNLVRYRDAVHSDSVQVDFVAVARGDADEPLQPGDRAFVPAAGEYHPDWHVTVRGEVARPGIYPLREGQDRISDMIRIAGGFLSTAAQRSVLVVRRSGSTLERDPEFDRLSRLSRQEMTDAEYQTFRTKLAAAQSNYLVNAEALVDGGRGGERDVLLQDDDLIVVDRREHAVRVTGRVRQPGLVEYDPSFRGQDYVARAGGYAEGASPKRSRVTRASSGQTVLLKDAGPIDPGDLIYIPEAPEKHIATTLRDFLVAAGSIATIVIAFRR